MGQNYEKAQCKVAKYNYSHKNKIGENIFAENHPKCQRGFTSLVGIG